MAELKLLKTMDLNYIEQIGSHSHIQGLGLDDTLEAHKVSCKGYFGNY
jgi:DNA helicase TIP49 (TBP-interacting protein)